MKKKVIIISIISLLVILSIIALLQYFLVYLPNKKEKEKWQEIFQQHYNNRIALFEKENKTVHDVDIVFVGDSITEGYDLNYFYPEYTALNRGIGGDTTFGVEKRLQVSIYDVKPKVVVMLIGANNFDTMLENYEDILISLKENLPETEIVILSLTAMSKDWGRNNHKAIENNKTIKDLASKYNYTFIDLYNPLIDPNTNQLYESYSEDGGHPNQLGYTKITNIIKPVLDEILSKK